MAKTAGMLYSRIPVLLRFAIVLAVQHHCQKMQLLSDHSGPHKRWIVVRCFSDFGRKHFRQVNVERLGASGKLNTAAPLIFSTVHSYAWETKEMPVYCLPRHAWCRCAAQCRIAPRR